MDEEDQSQDIQTLDDFLNPKAADAKEEVSAEGGEEEGKEEKPGKAVEAAKGQSFTAGLKAKIGKLPTPGSIAFPLLAVLVMILFVVPVGGKTRAVHLWNVLIGKEALSDETFTASQVYDKNTVGAGGGEYQDNVIQFSPASTRFTMIEEGTS
ncbi:MAG: hypothetical protein ACRD72_22320 [Candidatus Angelobacter sp.]